MFDQNTNAIAVGDCEDVTFLSATIYLAANIDVALVEAPGHVALLIWLPEYDNPNYYWDIFDGRDHGWIWVEATGEANPLGWTPPDFSDGDWETYILGFTTFSVEYSPENPNAEEDVTVKVTVESELSTVNDVILSYDVGSISNQIQMVNKGTYFEGVIPKQTDETRVVCEVVAIDNDGLTAERNFEYTVGQGFQFPEFPPFFIVAGIIILAVFLLIVVLALANS
jgi:hypothetical protein